MTGQFLDYHTVSDSPTPIYMGELPRDYSLAPARVIVNLCGVYPPALPSVQVLLCLPMTDTLDESGVPSRAVVERFLASVHEQAGAESSYWHCHAGINRSGFVLAAYLHRYRGLSISEAIRTLRDRRSGMVLCNNVFERTLRRWYGAEDEQDFTTFSMQDYLNEMRRHQALAARRQREIDESSG